MIKHWRPEGWKNPYINQSVLSKDKKTQWLLDNIYEKGAEAMLEALRRNQWCPYGKRVMNPGFRGKVVIIPDDKDS